MAERSSGYPTFSYFFPYMRKGRWTYINNSTSDVPLPARVENKKNLCVRFAAAVGQSRLSMCVAVLAVAILMIIAAAAVVVGVVLSGGLDNEVPGQKVFLLLSNIFSRTVEYL